MSICDLTQGNKYKLLGLKEIEKRLKILVDYYKKWRRPVKKVVLAGSNPFCLETDILIKTIIIIKAYFPKVENISCFVRADDILTFPSKNSLIFCE